MESSNKVNKKYQVFVSSTYKDLIEERAAVTQCLLEMGYIPVGMEQFPASNMSQMEYIKMMLDDCDYYILILAGKYGSIDSDGVGFTEKEYDYAIKKGIPVMSFIIKDPGTLQSQKCEVSDEGRAKLTAFRNKVCNQKLVKSYTDTSSLRAAVAISLSRCIQDYPSVGWIRGDSIDPPDDMELKIKEYMQKHAISPDSIDKHLTVDVDGETLVIGLDNTDPYSLNRIDSPREIGTREFLSIDGSRTTLEEMSKRTPKIELGRGPVDFKDNDIHFQLAQYDKPKVKDVMFQAATSGDLPFMKNKNK